MHDAPAPRPAATIIVVDDGGRVYLVKRHGKSGFMAGAHVFPGGRVDDADVAHARTLASEVTAPAAALASLGLGAADVAAGFLVAAIRETAEECGLLLARDKAAALADADAAAAVHRALGEGRRFADLLDERGLVPALDLLTPLAWWITPREEPKRFDTRFFLAPAPSSQRATVDAHEVTEGDWMTADDAVARYRAGQIALAPPTLVTLEDLRGARNLDEMKRRVGVAGRAICPRIITGDDGLVLALPGDPLHDDREPVFPGVRTRIVLNGDGRFESAGVVR